MRKGRFRKVFYSPEVLAGEAEEMEERLHPFWSRWNEGEFSSSDMAGLYIINYLVKRNPKHWLGGPHSFNFCSNFGSSIVSTHRPSKVLESFPEFYSSLDQRIHRRLAPGTTVQALFAHYSLKSIPLSVNKSLVRWGEGVWPITLMTKIPLPREVLNYQKRGERPATMLVKREELSNFVLGERDALGFLIHDLIHAERFFHDPLLYRGQVAFFAFMEEVLQKKILNHQIQSDPILLSDLEYVFSDMNASSAHLLSYLKSILIQHHLREEGRGPQDQLSNRGLESFKKILHHLREIGRNGYGNGSENGKEELIDLSILVAS